MTALATAQGDVMRVGTWLLWALVLMMLVGRIDQQLRATNESGSTDQAFMDKCQSVGFTERQCQSFATALRNDPYP